MGNTPLESIGSSMVFPELAWRSSIQFKMELFNGVPGVVPFSSLDLFNEAYEVPPWNGLEKFHSVPCCSPMSS